MTTEPVTTHRSWVYEYARPRQMGWPAIKRTGWEAPHKTYPDQMINAHKITITVSQDSGVPPELRNISVTGIWAGTKVAVERMKIYHDATPEQKLIIFAPDWVLELAADAVRRSAGGR
jgi:hypothetical protein